METTKNLRYTAPRHFRVEIRRMDRPGDAPDRIDEDNTEDMYWTPERLAASLRERYGPRVAATIEADGVRFELEGSSLRQVT